MVKKSIKVKVVRKRKIPIEKPYNNGTMSKAAFFSFIRSSLRRRTLAWKPIQVCKNNAKRPYIGPNKRQKFEYLCAECRGYFAEKEVVIDHIESCGSLNCLEDIPKFIERLFCEVEGLQILCLTCHGKKTIIDRQKIKNDGKE